MYCFHFMRILLTIWLASPGPNIFVANSADSRGAAQWCVQASGESEAQEHQWDACVQQSAVRSIHPIVRAMLRFKSLARVQIAGIAALLSIARLLDAAQDGSSQILVEKGAHLAALDAMRIRPSVHSIQNRGNELLKKVRILHHWSLIEAATRSSGHRRRRVRWFAVAVARTGKGLSVYESVSERSRSVGAQPSIGAGRALEWLQSSSVRWNVFRTRAAADEWLGAFEREQLTPKWCGLFQWKKQQLPSVVPPSVRSSPAHEQSQRTETFTAGLPDNIPASTSTGSASSLGTPTSTVANGVGPLLFDGKLKGVSGAPPPFSREVEVMDADSMPWALQLVESSCYCIGCGLSVRECCKDKGNGEAHVLHFPDSFDWFHGYPVDEPQSAAKRIDAMFMPNKSSLTALYRCILNTKLRRLGAYLGPLETALVPFWCASCWDTWIREMRCAGTNPTPRVECAPFQCAVPHFMTKCAFVYDALMRPQSIMAAIRVNVLHKVSLVQFSLAVDAFLFAAGECHLLFVSLSFLVCFLSFHLHIKFSLLFAADIALRDDISTMRWALLLCGADSKSTAIKAACFLDAHPHDFFALASALGMLTELPITAAHYARDELNIGAAADAVDRDEFFDALRRRGLIAAPDCSDASRVDPAPALCYQDFVRSSEIAHLRCGESERGSSNITIAHRNEHYTLVTAAACELGQLDTEWRARVKPFGSELRVPESLTEWLHVREYVVAYLQGDPAALIASTRRRLAAGANLLHDLSLALSRDEVVQEITDVGLVNTPFFNVPFFTQTPSPLIRRFGTVKGYFLMSLPTMTAANIFCWALVFKSVMSGDKGDPLLSSKAWDGLGRASVARGRNKARVVRSAWCRLLCELFFVPFKTMTPVLLFLSITLPFVFFGLTAVVDLTKHDDVVLLRVLACALYALFFGVTAASFGWVALLAIFDEGTY